MVSVLTSRKKKAILKWKEENPDKYFLDMKSNEVIKLNDCDYVNIGRMMSIFRSVYHAMQKGSHYGTYRDFTIEEIAWLEKQGMIWDYRKWKKDVSILAIEKWKRENPFSKYLDIKSSEQIELDGIGCIDIGQIIRRYRLIYHAMQQGKKYGSNYNLTDEDIKQLTELGMIWDREQFKKNEDVVVDDKLNNTYYKKQVFDDLDYMASVIRIKHSLTKEEFSEVLEDYVENFMADDKDNHTKNDTNKMLIMKK